MNAATVLAIVGIVVTIVWGAGQIFASYRPERKRALAYWVSETQLLGRRAQMVPIEVIVEGQTVQDPRLVRVHLVSYGKADIPSDAFDLGRSLVLDLDAPIRHVVGTEGIHAGDFAIDASSIEVHPHLIKAGAHYQWDLVCDGNQRDTISAPLVDTDTLNPREAWRRTTKVDWRLFTDEGVTGAGAAVPG